MDSCLRRNDGVGDGNDGVGWHKGYFQRNDGWWRTMGDSYAAIALRQAQGERGSSWPHGSYCTSARPQTRGVTLLRANVFFGFVSL